MKKNIGILLVFALSLLVACSRTVESDQNLGESTVKVAAIFGGPINDGSWNETQYNGLKRLESRDAQISFVEMISDVDSVEVMRTFATEGYDLVFLTTNGMQDLCFPLAASFPNTTFVQLNGSIVSDNFISIRIADEEQGFLAGVVAALWTDTGTVGFIGGQEITPILIGSLGFQQGVDYVNERYGTDVTTIRVNTGNFSNVNQAKETTIAMIERGVDIIVPMADAAGAGVIEAIEERGLMAVGTGSGHAIMAPDNVLVTIMKDSSYVYDAVWEIFINDTFPSTVETYGVARGVVYANDWLYGIDDTIVSTVEDIIYRIITGEIYISRDL